MSNQDQYPRLTQAQVELWLANPVTKVLSQCLEFYALDINDALAQGRHVDSSNADTTMSATHLFMGQKQGLKTAGDYVALFKRYQMLELAEKKEAEKDVEA